MPDQTQIDYRARVGTLPDGLSSTEVRAKGSRRHPLAWLVALGLAVILVAIAVAWWFRQGSAPVHYTTARISRGDVVQTVTATGTVNPELTIIVGTYVSGVIQQLFCDYNTEVKAGQICAKIDPRPYQATLNQYSGQLLRDQAILEKDRANLVRYQRLAAQNSIARQQAEDQQYLVHQDEGIVKIDEALVEGAKLNLGYTDIISPVDGTVVSRNVTQGQTVAASFQTPTLFLIATDLKKMEVDTNVSESDIGGIKLGDNATFTVDAFPHRVFEGIVSQVRQSPQTVQNVVTYDVVVAVDNRELVLKPGMTASTQIVLDQRKNVLRIPNQAMRYAPMGAAPPSSGEPRVWVLRDGNAVEIPVSLGLDDGNFTEVIRGDLAAGDAVITAETRERTGPQSAPPQSRL
jgi:HlyD family secretion protein